MHYLTSFSLIMGIVGALIVRSDCQCSCTDIEVTKHLLLQEMYKLRSEMQTASKETDSTKDMNARVEILEQRLFDFDNATCIKEKVDMDGNAQTGKTMKEKRLKIESVVRQTLKNEKAERLKFFNTMKTQIEKVDEKVQKTESMLEIKINNVVTDVKEIVNKELSAIDLLKTNVANVLKEVEMSNMAISKLQGQHQEHLEISERRFSIVQKQFSCLDDTWKKYGKKCYRFVKEASTWDDAKEKCRLIHGDLVRIENKEENDFIMDNILGGKYGFWIGLDDTQNENNWQWRSSEGTQKLGNFSSWAPGEPNDKFGDEDCGMIIAQDVHDNKGLWNDDQCSKKHSYEGCSICIVFARDSRF
ncbi:asialoglycoprotein receptor 1-like [Ruditapes philippinarum]|uniref:asialoglycoprotein receptor 1-like n=1 Tax=Ruditapes philippinarum TaxID=129788 RepID=UPI00295B31BE|nr:asialoglycoprotein receptor 1-like [Ruditapes philippinarum]